MSIKLLGDLVSPSKITRKGDKDIPFLSMNREEGLIINDRQNTSSNTQESSKIARYGQLVIGLHMNEGSIWVQNTTKEGAVSPAYNVLDINLDVVDPTYMNYALHTNECMLFYCSAGVGSTVRRSKVPWESLKTMPLRVPSLEEQKMSVELIKIANTLKNEIKLALNKISGMESKLFDECVKESSSISIENVATLTFGKTPTSFSESSVNTLTYISGASDFGEVYTNGKKRTDSAERIVDPYSVLVSVRDPVGKVNISSEKCAIGRGVVGITPKKEIADINYLYLALKKKEDTLNSMAYGIIRGIGPKEVKGITLDYTNIEEQKRLSESFHELEKLRTILQNMLISADRLYQKILQERFGCSVVT